MKKFLALFIVFSLFVLSSCSNDRESFHADFEITEQNRQMTEIIYNSEYTGETFVFDSDSINYSDIEDLFLSSLIFDDDSRIYLPKDQINVALSGRFTADDIKALEEICDTLNLVPEFVGIQEVSLDNADYIINFSDEEYFALHKDAYGTVSGADISIPYSLSSLERKTLLYKSIFRACGFQNLCDTPLDSILSLRTCTDTFTDTDLLLLEVLYTVAEPDMLKDEFLQNAKNYFINK